MNVNGTVPEEMDKSPVFYKRRCSGTTLSELPWNVSDVSVDRESEMSLLESDAVTPAKENVAPATKRTRKGWSDQPLPRKRTRSSTASGEDVSLKDRAANLFGPLLGRKGKDKDKDKGKAVEKIPTPHKQQKGKDVERTTPRKQAKDVVEKTATGKHAKGAVEKSTPRLHAITDSSSPGGSGHVVLHSPIEFVREKQAMFAEIDAFELESEEEEPEETTGKEMESELEFESSSKGESAGESPNTNPDQAQEGTSSKEVGEKKSPDPKPDQAQKGTSSKEVGEKESPNTKPDQAQEGTSSKGVAEKENG